MYGKGAQVLDLFPGSVCMRLDPVCFVSRFTGTKGGPLAECRLSRSLIRVDCGGGGATGT